MIKNYLKLLKLKIAERESRDSISTKVPLIVLILSLSVIFSAIVSTYFRYDKTLTAYQWVNRTGIVKGQLVTLKSILLDILPKTYLITGDAKYKADLEKGLQSSLDQLETVRQMTADNPKQQKSCDSLKQLIINRQQLIERLVSEQETRKDSLAYLDALEIKSLTDILLATIDKMNDDESDLLNIRTGLAASGERMSAFFLVIASAISFFFILFTYLMLVGAYKKQLLLRAELSQTNKDLNRSNAELEQFAYIASHDLQEPLRKLRTFSNMLQIKERERLSLEGKELLDRMQSFGARMQRLIEDLLMFSKMINKEITTTPVNLNKVIADIKSTVADAKNNKTIFINFHNLPVVNGYESQLSQLFQNLISNSIKYSKTDEDVKIDISATVISGSLIANAIEKDRKVNFDKINLKDNGIGFENQYSEKIFAIFQRLHGKGEYEGTGIGLAICKRVVENHKGYIIASSQPGIGTTISVYLPKS